MRSDLVLGQVYKNLYLVAGLDPASSGYQASVLWGIDQYRGELYLVDFENRRGGGIRAALDQMADWLHNYDCRHWIVEENGFQSAIRQDAAIKEFTAQGMPNQQIFFQKILDSASKKKKLQKKKQLQKKLIQYILIEENIDITVELKF